MRGRATAAALGSFLALAAPALPAARGDEPAAWSIQTLRGTQPDLIVSGMRDGTLTIEGGDPVAVADLLAIRPARAPLPPAGRPAPAIAVLTGGDAIYGEIVAATADETEWQTPSLGRVRIPARALRALLFRERLSVLGQEPDVLEQMRRPAAERQTGDLIVLASGDRPQGLVQSIAPEEIRLERGGRTFTFPASSIAAVRFFELEVPPAPEGPVASVSLADGSRASGTLTGWAPGTIGLSHPGGFALEIRSDQVREIAFRGGRFDFLSDLAPTAIDEKPYFRARGTAPEGYPTWAWRRDACAVDGTPLSLRGRVFARGVGAHAYSSLTYALDGRYLRFAATIGVDDSAARIGNERTGWGSVVFRVWVDDRKAFESGILTGTSPAQEIDVDLSGARSLRLEVDFGDRADILDRADWAGAYLERKP